MGRNFLYKFFLISLTITLIITFLVVVPLSYAQNTASPSAVSSFELFWPLTAGKTIDDSTYFLKSLKENIRGFLIFGVSEKANYAVLLATKRVLEAEKLQKENKKEKAEQTLKLALEQLERVEKNINVAKTDKKSLGTTLKVMQDRIANLENFLPQLDLGEAKKVLEKVKFLKNFLFP